MTFVRKAREQVGADPTHPSYDMVTSEDTTRSLQRVSDYLAQGFAKHQGDGPKLMFGDALESLKRAHTEVQEAPASSGLLDSEKANMEKTATTAAMLAMVDIDVNEAERGHLYALVEAQGDSEGSDSNAIVEDQMNAIDDMMHQADDGDLANIFALEDDEDEEGEDEVVYDLNDTNAVASLIEKVGHGPPASKEKVGPLKWLFQHGLGAIVARVAWLMLFSVGVALGLIRGAVIFPLLFIGCVLLKFAAWFSLDFGYSFLWEGDTGAFSRFPKIGQCAPAMWDAVGFDSSVANTAGQIFIQPATFASEVTGVEHLYRSPKSPCESVACGKNAACRGGQCYCMSGFYPPSEGESPSDCTLATTHAGCKCKSFWSHDGVIGHTSHYGCSAVRRTCIVDTEDTTYKTCSHKLKSLDGVVNSYLKRAMGRKKQAADTCIPLGADGKVPQLASK